MLVNKNTIKEWASLYAGLSFYYTDLLLLQETVYSPQEGLKHNFIQRTRVIKKNTLGTFESSSPYDIKKSIEKAALNSDVSYIFPNKTKVKYPYLHTYQNKLFALDLKTIKKINKLVNKHKKNFDNMDFKIKKTSKIFLSNLGSIINQDFITFKLQLKTNNRNIFNHYKINSLKGIKFPVLNNNKITPLKLPMLLSPKAVSKIALYLYKNKININLLKFKISPYLPKGLQSGLYDDDGTIRISKPFTGLKGGGIFSENQDCGYFYDFNERKYKIKIPDLSISPQKMSLKDLINNTYLLLNDFGNISLYDNELILNSDISLYGKGLDEGFVVTKIKFKISELNNIKKYTKATSINGFDEFSVKAPYFYLGGNYKFI